MAIIVGSVLSAIGAILFWISKSKLDALKKIEFDNRTDGGVVQFESYEDSKKHKWAEWRANMIGVIGVIIFIPGAFFLIGGLTDSL